MTEPKYGNLPFKEAIAFFRAKLNIPTERWNDVWRTGHNSGFMVAGALKDNLLNDFRQAVDLAIAEGKSLTWFKREFKHIVNRHGWDYTGSADWRSDIIYQTNMRQSYNAGRYEQLQHFDYWEYQHGDSITPRPHHLSWHGTVLPKDHKWWQTHMPQNGWGCKCKVRGRSKQALDRMGKDVTPAPKAETYEWIDKATGETHTIPKGIDPGFDYVPTKTKQLEKRQQVRAKASEPYQPPKRIAPTAFSTIKGVNVHGLNKVLDELASTSSQHQVGLLGEFLSKHNTKTVFIKQTEMGKGKAADKIKYDVADYLGLHVQQARGRYQTTRASRVGGFTAKNWDHLVVKAKASASLSNVDVTKLKQAADKVVLAAINNNGPKNFYIPFQLKQQANRYWSVTDLAEKTNDVTGLIATWLHELGHQIHFKADTPNLMKHGSVSQYGFSNHKENFAEWFTTWVLAPEQVKNYSEELYNLIEQAVQQAIGQ